MIKHKTLSFELNNAKTLADYNSLNIKYRKIDRGFSLSVINHGIKNYPKDKNIDYSYYLLVRTLVDYRSHEIEPIVKFMEKNFPKSKYLDDVNAELTYVYLKVFNLPKQGIQTIRRMCVKYPNGNAIDNACSWLENYFHNSCEEYFMYGETPTGICRYKQRILKEIENLKLGKF